MLRERERTKSFLVLLKEKVFFFEKKEAKNFYVFRVVPENTPRQRSKVFWFFFSKKNAFL
jgi:hypothetical protein